jgi:hypothetical protein
MKYSISGPDQFGNYQVLAPELNTIAVCWEEEDAKLIVAALNKVAFHEVTTGSAAAST